MGRFLVLLALLLGLVVSTAVLGQDESGAQVSDSSASELIDTATEKIEEQLEEVAEKVNEDPRAEEARESILKPIYETAEYLSFPSFHWIAFAMMCAGLVSFALQLVLGKLIMLTQFHFSLTEILADGLGFGISAIGLVLTTQAATENSTFTQSPALVLSAAGVGLFFGLIFYIRGQTQELREAREARRRKSSS